MLSRQMRAEFDQRGVVYLRGAFSEADHVDWPQIARLVQRGCSPRLALRIVR